MTPLRLRPRAVAYHGKVVPARIVLVVSMLCAGCAGNSTQPSQAPLGQPFELQSGASAILDGLTITFDRVASDSRCPLDASCLEFHAGDAVVAVSISQSAGGSVGRELHTNNTAGSEVSYLAYSIKLLSLSPYPRSNRQIRAGDYVATLVVARK